MIITTRAGGGIVSISEQASDDDETIYRHSPLYVAAASCKLLSLPPFELIESLHCYPDTPISVLTNWLETAYSEPHPTPVVGLGIHGHSGALLTVIRGDTEWEMGFHNLQGETEQFEVFFDGEHTTVKFTAPSRIAAPQILKRLSEISAQTQITICREDEDGNSIAGEFEDTTAQELPARFPPPDIVVTGG